MYVVFGESNLFLIMISNDISLLWEIYILHVSRKKYPLRPNLDYKEKLEYIRYLFVLPLISETAKV